MDNYFIINAKTPPKIMRFDLTKILTPAVALIILWIIYAIFGISSPYIPEDPQPPNGSSDINAENVLLCWVGGTPQSSELIKYAKLILFHIEPSESEVKYKIYLDRNKEFLTPPGEIDASIIKGKEKSYYNISHPLMPNTTYYWKIVTINDHGMTSEGPTWAFVTKATPKKKHSLINTPPILLRFKPDQESPQEKGTIIYWIANSQDSDGDTIYYRFLLSGPERDDKSIIVQDWSTKNSWAWTPDHPGKYQISVQIKEDNYPSDSYYDDSISEQYAILDNRPPLINSLTHDKPDFQAAGTDIIWKADAKDPDGDQILYRFFLSGLSTGSVSKPQMGWITDDTWIWKTSEADIGENQIEIWVRDSKHTNEDDFDDHKSAKFTISAPALAPAPTPVAPANRPPTVSNLMPDKSSPQVAGTAITWTSAESDPDNDPIQYRFFLDNQPQMDWSNNPSWTWTTTMADLGSHSIEVRVRDRKHNPQGDDSRTSQFMMTAPPNEPPVVNSMTPNKHSPQVAGTAITWTADAADLDSDPLQYRFFLDNQPQMDWSSSSTWTWTTTMADLGSHSIEVRVRDRKHNPQGDNVKASQFTINAPSNKPPVAINLTPDRQSPQEAGTAIVWTEEAFDPDGDQLLYKFLLNGPATNLKPQDMTGWISDNKWTWVTSQADIGNNIVTAEIRDGNHANENGYDIISVFFGQANGFTITTSTKVDRWNRL